MDSRVCPELLAPLKFPPQEVLRTENMTPKTILPRGAIVPETTYHIAEENLLCNQSFSNTTAFPTPHC